MKLVVLGATGGTGLEIVQKAVEQGHDVTAFVRSPQRLNQFQDRITIKEGNLLNSADLERAVRGHDAVLSGFGPRLPISKSDAHLLQQFSVALTEAMQKAHVKRVVVISTAFLFRDSVVPPTHLLGRLLFPSVVADSMAMERVFEESALDWTMIRPPQLTDKPFTGKYRMRVGHLPHFDFKISRADVADCFLKIVEDSALVHAVIGASNRLNCNSVVCTAKGQ
jgi:putative NADH-flavin reductase